MPRPGRFTAGKNTCTPCMKDWVGPRACLDKCEKFRPSPEFDPLPVQPVANCYTDWAIPVYSNKIIPLWQKIGGVTPCRVVSSGRRFERLYCLHLQDQWLAIAIPASTILTSQHYVPCRTTILSVLRMEIIPVNSENHTKHSRTFCGQNEVVLMWKLVVLMLTCVS
jgi:hypothetical protein